MFSDPVPRCYLVRPSFQGKGVAITGRGETADSFPKDKSLYASVGRASVMALWLLIRTWKDKDIALLITGYRACHISPTFIPRCAALRMAILHRIRFEASKRDGAQFEARRDHPYEGADARKLSTKGCIGRACG